MNWLMAEKDWESSSSSTILFIVASAGVLSEVTALKIHWTVSTGSGFALCSMEVLIIFLGIEGLPYL